MDVSSKFMYPISKAQIYTQKQNTLKIVVQEKHNVKYTSKKTCRLKKRPDKTKLGKK